MNTTTTSRQPPAPAANPGTAPTVSLTVGCRQHSAPLSARTPPQRPGARSTDTLSALVEAEVS
jgi:hypothetical protein